MTGLFSNGMERLSSRGHPRPSSFDSDDEGPAQTRPAQASVNVGRRASRRKEPIQHSRPRPPLTPTTTIASAIPQAIPNPLLPSAPASPPTPAPSPTPHQRALTWNNTIDDFEDSVLRDTLLVFSKLSVTAKESWLTSIVDACDSHSLSFLHHLVSPRLKKDPFRALPNELCFKVSPRMLLKVFWLITLGQILEFLDDPRTFVRASQVSRRWREIMSDDQAWKTLCEKHAYRRMSNESISSSTHNGSVLSTRTDFIAPETSPSRILTRKASPSPTSDSKATKAARANASFFAADSNRQSKRPCPQSSHRLHFKHRFLVQSAWRKGGHMTARHITPDQGVVTSLHLTKKYIVVALDNAKIHVFNIKGDHQRTLQGHVMGVWAMVPWGDILVSGGCDREVRVWNMATGYASRFFQLAVDRVNEEHAVRAYTLCAATPPRSAASKCQTPTPPSLALETQLYVYGTFHPALAPILLWATKPACAA